ncbi:MAG: hypothetical protein KY460_00650 [Actinobacteria bacterium]|nr:hypothetical protein [Actinomycetota bacterium]
MSTPTTEQSRVSRPLLIVLGVVAVAAVAYLALTLLTGSDEAAVEAAGPVPTGSEVPEASEAATVDPTEDPSEIAAVEPTFEVFDARDPFEQLVADDTGGGGSDTVGTTAPASDTTPAVDGTPPTDGDPSQTTVGGTTILLEDVFSAGGTKTALVVVDNEGYEATAGETVAGKVTVLDIAGNCATMRFEDRRFILCEGEQIQK